MITFKKLCGFLIIAGVIFYGFPMSIIVLSSGKYVWGFLGILICIFLISCGIKLVK